MIPRASPPGVAGAAFVAVAALLAGVIAHQRVQLRPGDSTDQPVGTIESFAPDLIVGLERTTCFGSCPAYKALLYADGRAYYSGRFNAPRQGDFTGVVTRVQLASILRAHASVVAERAPRSIPMVIDNQWTYSWVHRHGTDWRSSNPGFPWDEAETYWQRLDGFENEIDAVLDSIAWEPLTGPTPMDYWESARFERTPVPTLSVDEIKLTHDPNACVGPSICSADEARDRARAFGVPRGIQIDAELVRFTTLNDVSRLTSGVVYVDPDLGRIPMWVVLFKGRFSHGRNPDLAGQTRLITGLMVVYRAIDGREHSTTYLSGVNDEMVAAVESLPNIDQPIPSATAVRRRSFDPPTREPYPQMATLTPTP